MELSLAEDHGSGTNHVLNGTIGDLIPKALAETRVSLSIESAPTGEVPMGFRYLYAAPALVAQDTPVTAQEPKTLVVLGMNPNTAARADDGRLIDDATTRDIRALAGNTLTAPSGAGVTRVLFLTMAPFRGIIGKGGLGIVDALDDLPSYRDQHETNTRMIPAVLDTLCAEEGGLNIVTMWGNVVDKTSGRFALVGVRDLKEKLLVLADRQNVRWYSFGLTSSGAPRNYAGLRYLRGMSGLQSALRSFTLTQNMLSGFHCDTAWLSLADPRARMDRASLERALSVPRGVHSPPTESKRTHPDAADGTSSR